jgi:putative hydrolase of the HAD superfamily
LKQALCWDFHGTIEKPSHIWGRLMSDALLSCGEAMREDTIYDMLSSGYTWHTPDAAYVDRTGDLWWADLFAHFCPYFEETGIPAQRYDGIFSLFRKKILSAEYYFLFDDAKETLARCKANGSNNYILSNNFPELEQVVKALGLGAYFDGYIISALIGYEKPRIEIFSYAIEMADFPECAVMIGDNPVADIMGGCAAGMKTILVHGDIGDSGADAVAKELSEIPAILRAL